MANGARREFVQTGPCAAGHILGQIRPDRFFAQKHFVLTWPKSVTILPTERIERAELRASPLPE